MIRFQFKLNHDRLENLAIGERHQWSGMLYTRFLGTFVIDDGGDHEFRIDDVPMLQIAGGVHRLLTTPLLYGREESDHIPDLPIDLSSRLVGDEIRLTVRERETHAFTGEPLDALARFGTSYEALIAELAAVRPDIAKFELFMMQIPDGFTLSRWALYPATRPK